MTRRRKSKANRNVVMTMEEEPVRRRSSASAQLLIAAATAKLHFDEAAAHLRAEHFNEALNSYNEALELNPKDKEALVARSKCYILLGKPERALEDAETALSLRRNYIPGIYQKAEALYHLGQFEHSLVFYHRGLRHRPGMQNFRIGIQKAQEAIINTIGPTVKIGANLNTKSFNKSTSIKSPSQKSETKRPKSVTSVKMDDSSKQILGALATDKVYLEQLLKHPHLRSFSKENKNIIKNAEEALEFLNSRQKFWEQQIAPSKSRH